MPKTATFEVHNLCPGTDAQVPRASKAEDNPEWFPFTVEVYTAAAMKAAYPDKTKCIKCGALKFKIATDSQVEVEKQFRFVTKETRSVCASMGTFVERDKRPAYGEARERYGS